MDFAKRKAANFLEDLPQQITKRNFGTSLGSPQNFFDDISRGLYVDGQRPYQLSEKLPELFEPTSSTPETTNFTVTYNKNIEINALNNRVSLVNAILFEKSEYSTKRFKNTKKCKLITYEEFNAMDHGEKTIDDLYHEWKLIGVCDGELGFDHSREYMQRYDGGSLAMVLKGRAEVSCVWKGKVDNSSYLWFILKMNELGRPQLIPYFQNKHGYPPLKELKYEYLNEDGNFIKGIGKFIFFGTVFEGQNYYSKTNDSTNSPLISVFFGIK